MLPEKHKLCLTLNNSFGHRAQSKNILHGSRTVEQICLGRVQSIHTELWSRRSKHNGFRRNSRNIK